MKMQPDTYESGFVSSGGKPTDDTMKLKIACVVLALLLLFLGARTITGIHSTEKHIAKQKTQIEELKKELEQYETTEQAVEAEEQKPEESQSQSDNETAEVFFKKLLTWNSYDGYEGVRNWLLKDLGMKETDPLLASFMPKLSAETLGESNMKFDSAETYLTEETEGIRNYFAICKVTNKLDGNTGTGHVGIFYSVDGEGSISNASAFSLAR